MGVFRLSTAIQQSSSNLLVYQSLLMMLVESEGQELGQGTVGMAGLCFMMFKDSPGKTQTAGGWNLLEQRLANYGLQAKPAQHLHPFL